MVVVVVVVVADRRRPRRARGCRALQRSFLHKAYRYVGKNNHGSAALGGVGFVLES